MCIAFKKKSYSLFLLNVSKGQQQVTADVMVRKCSRLFPKASLNIAIVPWFPSPLPRVSM